MIAVGDQLLSIDRHDVEASRIEDLSYLLPGPEGSEVCFPMMAAVHQSAVQPCAKPCEWSNSVTERFRLTRVDG
jgi:hypothetical protein